MTEEEKQDVIEDLVKALEFYADDRYWQVLYGHMQQSDRIWVGPGQGPDMARRSLKKLKEVMNE